MTRTPIANPIFVALDTPELAQATSLAARLADVVGGIKLGLEFFAANGPKGVKEVSRACALPLFLDLKFHDIPHTVAGAIRAACWAQPVFLDVHASGGRAMMEAAVEAARDGAAQHLVPRPLVLAVTVLTSLDSDALSEVGLPRSAAEHAAELALLAKECGVDGVVCSPQEVASIRKACGTRFKLMVPGVRPVWAGSDDQKRVMTPAETLAAGADYLVIGRPITAASDPRTAARKILSELAETEATP